MKSNLPYVIVGSRLIIDGEVTTCKTVIDLRDKTQVAQNEQHFEAFDSICPLDGAHITSEGFVEFKEHGRFNTEEEAYAAIGVQPKTAA